MRNDLPPELAQQGVRAGARHGAPVDTVAGFDGDVAPDHDDTERNAYNAAFHALGLHWHWDRRTFDALKRYSAAPEVRIGHYLETEHPHLLRAYDTDFLVAAIHARKCAHRPCADRSIDWAQVTGWELGV